LRLTVTAFLLITLGACQPTNFALTPDERSGPPVPLGTQRTQSVDGITVGHRLMEAEEFELALSAYQRAASETGVNAEVLSGMGSANLRLGRLQQARTLLEKAVEQYSESASAWNNFGVVLINLGDFQQARQAFRVAYGVDNGNSELIRRNLILANRLIDEQSAEIAREYDFSLVRYGNGSYLLLGNI
jgi:Flp pilus assembly protein TadD